MLTSPHTVCFRTEPEEPASLHAKKTGVDQNAVLIWWAVYSATLYHVIRMEPTFDPSQIASSAMHVPLHLKGSVACNPQSCCSKKCYNYQFRENFG